MNYRVVGVEANTVGLKSASALYNTQMKVAVLHNTQNSVVLYNTQNSVVLHKEAAVPHNKVG